MAFTVLTTEEPRQFFFTQFKKGVNDSLFSHPVCLSQCLNVVCTVLADTSAQAHLILLDESVCKRESIQD